MVLLALIGGVCIAVQATMNAAAGRSLGLPTLIAFSGFATGTGGLIFALLSSGKPDFTFKAVALGIGSGIIGCAILTCVTFAVSQGGIARALSLILASQLIAGLVIERLGFFGEGLSFLKVMGVVLIVVGGILVVRF